MPSNYRVTTTLSDPVLKDREARNLYIKYAAARTEHARMPGEIRMLEEAANSRRRMIQENLKSGLYQSHVNEQMRLSDEKLLSELKNHIQSYQELKKDWEKRIDACRQEMAEKHVPWFDRSVNVLVRNMDSNIDANPYLDITRSVESGKSAKAKSDELKLEIEKDLSKYLDSRDFKVVPTHEEQKINFMGVPAALVGALVVFPSAIEDDVKMAMANVVRDRIMSHPDIQGTGREGFDELRSTVREIGIKESISLMEYEFIDRYGKFENSVADLVLHGEGEISERLKQFETYEQATLLLPGALRNRKEVDSMLEQHYSGFGPSTDDDKKLELELLKIFSKNYDPRIRPTADSELGLG